MFVRPQKKRKRKKKNDINPDLSLIVFILTTHEHKPCLRSLRGYNTYSIASIKYAIAVIVTSSFVA